LSFASFWCTQSFADLLSYQPPVKIKGKLLVAIVGYLLYLLPLTKLHAVSDEEQPMVYISGMTL